MFSAAERKIRTRPGALLKRTLFLPKATCVCLFPLVHGHGEIAVGLRAKAADQFAHGRDARRAEKLTWESVCSS